MWKHALAPMAVIALLTFAHLARAQDAKPKTLPPNTLTATGGRYLI